MPLVQTDEGCLPQQSIALSGGRLREQTSLWTNTQGSRARRTQHLLGPESNPSSPSIESRGPHGYGCSSCLIHDKMSCAEIRDSVRGKKAVLASVHFC